MIPLGQCIVCREICWLSRGQITDLKKLDKISLEKITIVKTRAGYMHRLCYVYKGRRLVQRETRIPKRERYNAYNRDKQVWV